MTSGDNQLGRMEGVLTGLKELVEFRFDKLESSMEKTVGIANDATEMAAEAHDKANEAHEYSKGIVKRAGWLAGVVTTCVGGAFYIIDHFPRIVFTIFNIK